MRSHIATELPLPDHRALLLLALLLTDDPTPPSAWPILLIFPDVWLQDLTPRPIRVESYPCQSACPPLEHWWRLESLQTCSIIPSLFYVIPLMLRLAWMKRINICCRVRLFLRPFTFSHHKNRTVPQTGPWLRNPVPQFPDLKALQSSRTLSQSHSR